MTCTRLALLLLLVGGCASAQPAFTQSGRLPIGASISVHNRAGNISVYAPERGQPSSEFTLEAFGRSASRTRITKTGTALNVVAATAGVDFLVRGPKDSRLTLTTASGTINVADFDGIVDAYNRHGDIKMLLPQYANARTGTGNISVIFASTTWPGTLHFSARRGDIELYVNETAAAQIHLATQHGTIFTDFPLTGSASGSSERIDGVINGGARRAISVRVDEGSIRLLQLKPQV